MGPNESITARFIEDNPGRWLYHCHVFTHQDAGMAGWYVVEPQ
jgi:FtsP/CotA-like multicopper oxidase with cupredoxin domain